MSTRFSVRMTCALLAGIAATVGFATPVIAQSSDLSSSLSKPSTSESPKPSDKPTTPDERKNSEHVLGKDYKATTECEGSDVILNVEFTAPERAFYHVVLHDVYHIEEAPLTVVDRWVEQGEKVTFRKEVAQRHPLVLVSTRVDRNVNDTKAAPPISKDSLGAGPCIYPGKDA